MNREPSVVLGDEKCSQHARTFKVPLGVGMESILGKHNQGS